MLAHAGQIWNLTVYSRNPGSFSPAFLNASLHQNPSEGLFKQTTRPQPVFLTEQLRVGGGAGAPAFLTGSQVTPMLLVRPLVEKHCFQLNIFNAQSPPLHLISPYLSHTRSSPKASFSCGF